MWITLWITCTKWARMQRYCVLCCGHESCTKEYRSGHNRFAQYVIPLLVQNGWPASWQCMQGTIPDTKHGIDYMVGTTPVAARIWDGTPKQHFALRWYNTRHEIRMELTKLLVLWANNEPMPKYTIEAYTHNNRTYVAVCQTHMLAQIVADNMDTLPHFMVTNHATNDFTVFVRVPFDLFPPDAIHKIIG